jgi:hypothetical protein
MEVAFLDVDFHLVALEGQRGVGLLTAERTSTGCVDRVGPLGASDRQAKANSSLTLTQPSPRPKANQSRCGPDATPLVADPCLWREQSRHSGRGAFIWQTPLGNRGSVTATGGQSPPPEHPGPSTRGILHLSPSISHRPSANPVQLPDPSNRPNEGTSARVIPSRVAHCASDPRSGFN